ncbi:MAG: EamA family transporter [Planctomycetia bacterium]|nr:EamA family transporter [Planctomycetia bacterium]
MSITDHWLFWALLSAVFAALTAIFAKVGLEEVDADYATLIRTAVIFAVLAFLVWGLGKWRSPLTLPPSAGLFLILSGLATGASWFCYFRALKAGAVSQVAPIDKLSVVLVAVFATLFLNERPAPIAWLGICCIGFGAALIGLQR